MIPPPRRVAAPILLGLAALCPLAAPGCGPGLAVPDADRAAEARLQQVGQMLRDYQLANGRPPRSLKQLEQGAGESLGGFELIRGGEVVLVAWGVPLPDTREEPGASPDPEVLAHGRGVPERGGAVLLLNRTIRRLTAAEFQAAPKVAPGRPDRRTTP